MKTSKELAKEYATETIVDLDNISEDSYPDDQSWRDLWEIAHSAYEEGYKQGLINSSIQQYKEESDEPFIVGYLGKAWGEKGYRVCEVGHSIYRNKLYDMLTYSRLEDSFEKTALFPIGTFDDTMTKV